MIKPASTLRMSINERLEGQGLLSLVATPVGNLDDISARAIETLTACDIIAAEDTRHSGKLLKHYGIATPLLAYHEHSSSQQQQAIIDRLKGGQHIALISDAGMPLIADPGYQLVNAAVAIGSYVSVVPGASAVLSALVLSGLPSHSFTFLGFVPSKSNARDEFLYAALQQDKTQILYESCHRILRTVQGISALAPNRPLAVAREITKRFETVYRGTAIEIASALSDSSNDSKGEFVIVLAGDTEEKGVSSEGKQLMKELIALLPPKKAAAICAKTFSGAKSEYYNYGLSLKAQN